MSDHKTDYSPPNDGETRPLPDGWIKQFDPRSNAYFYVDTKAAPPRSIWVHPYDDPQYLEKHPEAKQYNESSYEPPSSPPPVPSSSRPNVNDKGKTPEKRGILGKMKDSIIGTKEEREAAKRLREQQFRERQARQQALAAQYGPPPQHYGAYPQGPYAQGPYQQAPYGYGYNQPAYAQPAAGRSSRLGGGSALPLAGGLLGGLLVGEAIGGLGDGFGDGGDFGGGDFGGGDF